MKRVHKKLLMWLMWIVLSPVILILVLAILIYIPPIQNFIVGKVAGSLSESTGMEVSVGHVRLAFPLDLSVQDVNIVDKGDTVLAAKEMLLDVQLLPLFEGRADIDGFSLQNIRVNTKSFVADTYVRGHIDRLEAQSHGVEWNKGNVRLNEARISDAELYVALSDTAAVDTLEESAPWNIIADRIALENVKINLSMPGDSMRLMAHLGKAEMRNGHFDTGKPYYAVGALDMAGSTLTYATFPYTSTEKTGNAAFMRSNALLWDDFFPTQGFDPSCIELTGLSLRLDSLSYDAAGTLRTNIRNVAFNERSGLSIDGISGRVYMDSVRLSVPSLQLRTPSSVLNTRIDLAMKALETGQAEVMGISLEGHIGAEDLRTLGIGYLPEEYLEAWPEVPLTLRSTLSGNVSRLIFTDTELGLGDALTFSLDGEAEDLLGENLAANARFDIKVQDASVLRHFIPADAGFALPHGTTATGTLAMKTEQYTADMRVAAGKGDIKAKALFDTATERYDIAATATAFPLSKFMPGSGMGDLTADLAANGRSFDLFSPLTRFDAKAAIRKFHFGEYDLGGISFDATAKSGKLEAHLNADNTLVEGRATLTTQLSGDKVGTFRADLPHINLQQLASLEDTLYLGTNVNFDFYADKRFTAYGIEGGLRNIRFITPDRGIPAKNLNISFATNPDTTTARISAGDLYLNLGAAGDIDRLSNDLSHFMTTLAAQSKGENVHHEVIKNALPSMRLLVDAGTDNPLSKILHYKGISYTSASISVDANPTLGIGGDMKIKSLKNSNFLLDDVHFRAWQDTLGLRFDANVKNHTKKNPNKFEAILNTYIRRTEVGGQFKFLDEDGDTNTSIGLRANFGDEGLNVSFFPHHSIIAYRTFTVNDDNFVFLGKNKQIRANVDLLADDGTGLRIACAPNDSVNDLTLSLSHFNLGELCSVFPYLPRMTGTLNGDLHVVDEYVAKSLSTAASIMVDSFTYEGMDIGNIGLDAIYMPKEGGEHYANAYITHNDNEVLDCEGTYFNQGEGHFDGTANMHDFPLQMLNGFLAGTDVALRGSGSGSLHVAGNFSAPKVNGQLKFSAAHLYSEVYGFDFSMDERPIEIKDNKMTFTDYALHSKQNKNPLMINGALDFSDLNRMKLDFKMEAQNFELINTKRTPLSIIFGKVYANYNGTLTGTTEDMSINGKITVLDRTDMTYILKDSPLTVEDGMNGLVQFVDFSDTTTVATDPVIVPSSLNIVLGIAISDAARFRCNLSEDGSNYVELEGGGELTMRLTRQGEMTLTGSFTANSGEMKYSLPVIPLKTFSIVQGSSVKFTGDILNPTLDIAAKERIKATVTENDQPRSVAFDVGVKLSKPLSNMGLEFTIDAPEDMNVQNHLAAMSADQRSKTAVTMLATGMYLTDEMLTGNGSGFKASNALNAFLQHEIQNIAGSALKTLDITIGMENNTSSTGAETTDYSFQFAKRFWNNRVSVIVGGKVSTGEDAQNSASSFIDNVTIEYRLDKSATRYVKVFYDRSSHDPLEGQLTETGAGIILRRKTNNLGELFIFSRPKDKSKKINEK